MSRKRGTIIVSSCSWEIASMWTVLAWIEQRLDWHVGVGKSCSVTAAGCGCSGGFKFTWTSSLNGAQSSVKLTDRQRERGKEREREGERASNSERAICVIAHTPHCTCLRAFRCSFNVRIRNERQALLIWALNLCLKVQSISHRALWAAYRINKGQSKSITKPNAHCSINGATNWRHCYGLPCFFLSFVVLPKWRKAQNRNTFLVNWRGSIITTPALNWGSFLYLFGAMNLSHTKLNENTLTSTTGSRQQQVEQLNEIK